MTVEDNAWEVRGVSFELLKSIANLAKAKDSEGLWTIGRIGSELVGNHEILKPGHRWGNIKPEETITFSGQCSVIELLRQDAYSVPHPVLNVSYEGNVDIANKFISFAYNSDFLELINCLERYFAEHGESPKDAFFWFDALVNNQWVAADKSFDWWATTFRTAVNKIGHTLLFLTPWEAPVMLTRAWCLFEIACSENLTCLLSRQSEINLWEAVGKNPDIIIASLCNVDLAKSGTYLPTDRERIFQVVEQKEGGFLKINSTIGMKIRNWLCQSLDSGNQFFVQKRGENDPMTLGFATRVASVYYLFQNYEKSEYYYQFSYEKSKAVLGDFHITTIGATVGMAIMANYHGSHAKAIELYQDAIKASEQCLHLEVDNLNPEEVANRQLLQVQFASIYSNMALVYHQLFQFETSVKYLEKCLEIREHYRVPIDLAYYNAMETLGIGYRHLERHDKVDHYYGIVFAGLEKLCGPNHIQYLSACVNRANDYKDRKLYDLAKEYYEKALIGYAKSLGTETPMYALILRNYGLFFYEIKNYSKAKELLWQSYQLYRQFQTQNTEQTSFGLEFYLQVLEKTDGIEAVKKVYEEELKDFNPESLQVWNGSCVRLVNKYGLLCMQLNDWEKAEIIFRQLIQVRYSISKNPDFNITIHQLPNISNLPTLLEANKNEDILPSTIPESKESSEFFQFFSASAKKGKVFAWTIEFLVKFVTSYVKQSNMTAELYKKHLQFYQLFYQSCLDLFGFHEPETSYIGILYGMCLYHYHKDYEISKIHEILNIYEKCLENFVLHVGNDNQVAVNARFVLGALWKDHYKDSEELLAKGFYHAKLAYELYDKKLGPINLLTINALYIVALIYTLQNNIGKCFQSWLLCCNNRYQFYLQEKTPDNQRFLEREVDMFCRIMKYITEKHFELYEDCLKGIEMIIQSSIVLEKREKFLSFLAQLTCRAVTMIPLIREKNKSATTTTTESNQEQQPQQQLSTNDDSLDELKVYLRILPELQAVSSIPPNVFIVTYYSKLGSHYSSIKDFANAKPYLYLAYTEQTRLTQQSSPNVNPLSDMAVFTPLWQYFLCLSKLPGSHPVNHEILQILGYCLISSLLLPSPKHEQLYNQMCQLNLQISNNVQIIKSLEEWIENIHKQFNEIEKDILSKTAAATTTSVNSDNEKNSTEKIPSNPIIINSTTVDPTIMITRISKFYEFLYQSNAFLGKKLITIASSMNNNTNNGNEKDQTLVSAAIYLRKAFHSATKFYGKEHTNTIQIMFSLVSCLKSLGTFTSYYEACDEYLKDYCLFFHEKFRLEKKKEFENFYFSGGLIFSGMSSTVRRYDDAFHYGKLIMEYIYFYSSSFYQKKEAEEGKEQKESDSKKDEEAQTILLSINEVILPAIIELSQFDEGIAFYQQIHSLLLQQEEQDKSNQDDSVVVDPSNTHTNPTPIPDANSIANNTNNEKEAILSLSTPSLTATSSKKFQFFIESIYLSAMKKIQEEQQKYQEICRAYPDSILHPSHPDHSLLRIRCGYRGGEFSCDLCHQSGRGLVFHCKECSYDLHLACACPDVKPPTPPAPLPPAVPEPAPPSPPPTSSPAAPPAALASSAALPPSPPAEDKEKEQEKEKDTDKAKDKGGDKQCLIN